MNKRAIQGWGLLILSVVVLGILVSCSGAPGDKNPKDVVISLFGAMERDERATIAHLLDMPALMSDRNDDYALQRDEARVFHNPEELLNDLTGEGTTKRAWFSLQRVIGDTEIAGDTALVEVSFMNKRTGTLYYTQFGLHRAQDRWKIFSFKANQ